MSMNSKWRVPGLVTTLLLALPGICFGDINVVKEVVIAPKGVHAAANIGSVNSSPNVRMARARVDIKVGTPGGGAMAPISLNVRATFEMVNESSLEILLTVGFPISNSEFSSFRFDWFRVSTDGVPREVFRRKAGYPRNLVHEYVSGVLGPDKAVPPTDIDRASMKLMGDQIIGGERFGNLMVWEERFSGGQKKTIEVLYEIQMPLQENALIRKRAKGNYKGTWPQEANNVPAWFLKKLSRTSYYFFDYYLTSGASWSGPISEEDIFVHFGPWWNGHEFHVSTTGILSSGGRNAGPGAPTTHYYMLRNQEPAENLYFAVRPRKLD